MSSTPIVTQVDTAFNIEPGATMPIVISGESGTFVVFRIAGSNDSWGVLNCATVRIRFGEPNDEDLPNHPLYQYGLGYYGIFVIKAPPGFRSWSSQMTPREAPLVTLCTLLPPFTTALLSVSLLHLA